MGGPERGAGPGDLLGEALAGQPGACGAGVLGQVGQEVDPLAGRGEQPERGQPGLLPAAGVHAEQQEQIGQRDPVHIALELLLGGESGAGRVLAHTGEEAVHPLRRQPAAGRGPDEGGQPRIAAPGRRVATAGCRIAGPGRRVTGQGCRIAGQGASDGGGPAVVPLQTSALRAAVGDPVGGLREPVRGEQVRLQRGRDQQPHRDEVRGVRPQQGSGRRAVAPARLPLADSGTVQRPAERRRPGERHHCGGGRHPASRIAPNLRARVA